MTEEEIKNKKNCVSIDKTKFKGKDHAEEIYNYLKCIEPSYRVGRKIYWKCVCLNCGSITYCRIDQLQNNEILSCGCHKESKKVHIGDIFGRLTVIDFAEDNSCGQKCFKCRCSCGNTVIVAGNKLRTGHTKSCGCLNKEITKKLSTTHGFSKTRYGVQCYQDALILIIHNIKIMVIEGLRCVTVGKSLKTSKKICTILI